jgi:uncharacterized damage-inducible protein DinB
MPLASLFQELEYDRWANHRVMNATAQLDAKEFTRNMGSSFASIRDTLVHMIWAEWLWLERWQGHSPKVQLNPLDFPTQDSVREYWLEIEAGQDQFLGRLPEGSEQHRVRYTNFEGVEWEYSLGQMVHHLVVHSAYHRGQVTTMLRQVGMACPQTDYLVYEDSKAGADA